MRDGGGKEKLAIDRICTDIYRPILHANPIVLYGRSVQNSLIFPGANTVYCNSLASIGQITVSLPYLKLLEGVSEFITPRTTADLGCMNFAPAVGRNNCIITHPSIYPSI